MSSTQAGTNTIEEIRSQPAVWERTLHHLQMLNASSYPRFHDYDQVIFTGCGSTYYLSLWAARACEKQTGLTSRAAPASDLLYATDGWLHKSKKTLLVAISRSAETTETILALRQFTAGHYGDSVVVTCYPDRELAKLSPNVVAVPDAQEQSVAQTRSFSSMLLAVGWLLERDVPQDVPAALSQAGARLMETYGQVASGIGRDESIKKLFYLGSGSLYGLACEAMLKMKEMSLTYSEAFHEMEFRHGPMSMVDEESLMVGLIGDSTKDQGYAVLREMRAKNARTLGLLDGDGALPPDTLDETILFKSRLPELWRAPLYLPVLQLIAYERALHKGLNPDRPTNLSAVVVLHD